MQLEVILKKNSMSIDLMIEFVIDDDLLVKRITGR